MKSDTKTYYSLERNERKRTGGGPPNEMRKPKFYDEVLSIIQIEGPIALEGLSPVQADSDYIRPNDDELEPDSEEVIEYSDTENLIEDETNYFNDTGYTYSIGAAMGNFDTGAQSRELLINADPLNINDSTLSQSQNQPDEETSPSHMLSNDESDRPGSVLKQARRMPRQNNKPYGRFLTKRSEEMLSNHKQSLMQSQINVQNLLAKEIHLRCEKTQMQVDLMRKQKRVEELKVSIEEKKAELQLMKLEKELQIFRANSDQASQNETDNN